MAFNLLMKIVVLVAISGVAMGGIAPVAPLVSAPLVAPAAIGYAKAVPQNIPPFASRVDINTRALAAPFVAAPAAYSAPFFAAPAAYAAPATYAAPLAPTAYSSPFVAAAYGPTVFG